MQNRRVPGRSGQASSRKKRLRLSRPRAQRLVQSLSLTLFLVLLASAFANLASPVAENLFLRLDPLVALGTALSARDIPAGIVPGLLVLALAPLLGRLFCGWVCPMGVTVDCVDALMTRRRRLPRNLRQVKYWLLALVLGSALLGVSLVFLAAPMPLVTRLWGLVAYPLTALSMEKALPLMRPVADALDIRTLLFLEIRAPFFATMSFVAVFFGLVFAASRLSPRFWCRYVCPAGASLALLSRRPVWRRRVSEKCIECGKCQRACPMQAIAGDPHATLHGECILCRVCAGVCPTGAIDFPFSPPVLESQIAQPTMAGRRAVLAAGATGAAGLVMGGLGLAAPLHAATVRPPGSAPEDEFLSRCMRCGQCALACPTNIIQPVWFSSGLLGVFSPTLTPVRGFCDPHCHECGKACPTLAIRPLPSQERVWAKLGTAEVNRETCLAWKDKKKCLVCDEVCPYGAVELKPEPGNPVYVPHVDEKRCAGCGYCEHFCPVRPARAIRVGSKNQIRLSSGSLESAAKTKGLSLSLKQDKTWGIPAGSEEHGLPPGFSPLEESGTPGAGGEPLPPGFSPLEPEPPGGKPSS